jgi:hypothetical protein
MRRVESTVEVGRRACLALSQCFGLLRIASGATTREATASPDSNVLARKNCRRLTVAEIGQS